MLLSVESLAAVAWNVRGGGGGDGCTLLLLLSVAGAGIGLEVTVMTGRWDTIVVNNILPECIIYYIMNRVLLRTDIRMYGCTDVRMYGCAGASVLTEEEHHHH
jgi:hypothetical protein